MTTSSAPHLEGHLLVAPGDSDEFTGGTGGAERVIWLTPDRPAITVAGQRRGLTELPPRGSITPYPLGAGAAQ
jgi:hypothetical protein